MNSKVNKSKDVMMTDSKSDNVLSNNNQQAVYYENSYLSRKIERQQMSNEYYHGAVSQGAIKRPLAVS